ncbi:DUF2463 domain-containing protein [Encephalitozoon hellem]|uniref:DUF2463 domain-containing protein n=1 Tax=Encephalitozoon hellem TaxID=27973 RepID=A0ABY8CLI1_ENCHE|nr:DUF2463 domain-containing protein [Encephalitozoon hellem]WEL38153.1 DUF2463 domain-containing protein [Encephalitozoon hellem]WEL38327.1 DUF2463 domain-containing protein [Encephalitozoon hellem]WEL38528.1 DUF2463 domain-containing protein [Encephalitozoon hellem]
MKFTINPSQLYPIYNHIREGRIKLDWKDAMQIYLAPTSIILPSIICLSPKENIIRHSISSKLAIVLPPFLYSGIQYFILFNNTREQSEQTPTEHTPIHILLNTLLLLFSAISFLSTIPFTIDPWNRDSKALLPIAISPFLVSSTHLLTTSCTLTRYNFHYTPTGSVDILLDLLIFLSITPTIPSIHSNINPSPEVFYLIILSAILTMSRSWKEKCLPSAKYNGPTKIWRVAIPITILASATIIYAITAYASLVTLKKEL